MKINTKYRLSESEILVCQMVGGMRQMANRFAKVKDGVTGDFRYAAEPDVVGFMAEFAFTKIFNISPDLTVKATAETVDKGDCVLNGITLDVKYTRWVKGHLLCHKKKNSCVAAFCLMTGEAPEFTFRGFYPAYRLLVPERIDNTMKKPCYAARQDELMELEDLTRELIVEFTLGSLHQLTDSTTHKGVPQ